MLKAPSPLSGEMEQVVETVIGCGVKVHPTMPFESNSERAELHLKVRSACSSSTRTNSWAPSAWILSLKVW
jgi:hypothetical protein